MTTLVDKLEAQVKAEQRRVHYLMSILEAASHCIGKMCAVKEARDQVDVKALALVSAHIYTADQVDFSKVDTNIFAMLALETIVKGLPKEFVDRIYKDDPLARKIFEEDG